MASNEELVILIRNGNRDLLGQLYSQNSGMIEKIVRRYSGYEDPEDLRQEAFFGIKQACSLWDPEAGADFITYSVYWIRAALSQYVEKCGSVIRVPSHQRGRIRKYKRMISEYRAMFGRDPSGPELAAALEITPDQLEDVKRDAAALRIRSTAEAVNEDGNITLEDALPDPRDHIGDLVDQIQAEELAGLLWSLVDALEGKEAAVLRGRYQEGKTLRECGNDLGMSAERVRQTEEKALRKMRKPSVTKRLKPFIDDYAYSMGVKIRSVDSFQRTGQSSTERAAFRLMELKRRLDYDNIL